MSDEHDPIATAGDDEATEMTNIEVVAVDEHGDARGVEEARAAKTLALGLAALPELEMRQSAFLRYLHERDAAAVVPVLARIQQLGRKGGPPFDVALLAMASTLSRDLVPYEALAELYRAAKDGGFATLGQLFFSGGGHEQPPPEPRDRDEQRLLTLGHRKTMARSTDRDVLDRLLRDPEVPVVHNLLENPRLVERDVVQLAARRPTDPEVQRVIFSSRRWICRYAVKRALVLNPYTPTELAIRLLGFLTSMDLKLVRQTPTLSETVRQAAEQLATDRQR
ncbi:MAG: hypothetical protein CSB49_01935 [Proteobacteria bacterium]|nr:MAG: hypothetical protein CSB49_01935 [Pseudomonadota bacterium]